jgi:DNA-binding Lrp family transcriptional regulator
MSDAGAPSRPKLVAEELLLYDKDGNSLLDDHALRILIALHQEKLTAQEISQRYRVPIAPCYRRIRRLLSLGLVSEAGFVTEGRRRPARLYKSEVDRFTISYGSAQMLLHLLLRNGVAAEAVVALTPEPVLNGTGDAGLSRTAAGPNA